MKKLYRSRKDKIISGICGGLGNYFRIDPFFFRLIFLILLIFTGFLPMFLGYLIASLIIPLEPKAHIVEKYRRLYRSKKNRRIAGVFGGIGEVYHVDPTMLRLLYIIFLIFTGVFPLLLCYLIAWMILPEK